MKYFKCIPIALLITGAAFISCNSGSGNGEAFGIYGDSTITEEGAIAAEEIASRLIGLDSLEIKLKGQIGGVCQAKGCWLNVAIGNDDEMTVRFKDYGFFVPKNSSGREAILQGIAFVDTISVADLQHKAQDAGKSADEIAKITQPEVDYVFMASGVIIK